MKFRKLISPVLITAIVFAILALGYKVWQLDKRLKDVQKPRVIPVNQTAQRSIVVSGS